VISAAQKTQPPFPCPRPQASAAASRQTFTVARGDVVEQATYPGRVTLADQRELFFGASGRVEEILVNSGDFVVSGTVVAELDMRGLDFDLARAQIAQDLATQRAQNATTALELQRLNREYDLQVAKIRLEQLQTRRNPDAIATAIQEIAVRQAELALQQLDFGVDPSIAAEVARAEIGLNEVQANIQDSQIVAPLDGQVLFSDMLQRGQLVQPYEAVATLADTNALVVEANLVPADLERLNEGMAVALRIGGEGGPLVDGVILRMPQPYGTGTRTVTEVALADAADAARLRPGATVDIVAELSRADNVLWLPPAAVQGFRDNYFVRLADGSEAPVQVGILGAERVEIRSGVTEGQQVVGAVVAGQPVAAFGWLKDLSRRGNARASRLSISRSVASY
jgi:multidrug efflux pump subunit AcrA (membrane-fusion protein)